MTATYSTQSRTLAANVLLEAAVAAARARLAGPLPPAAYFNQNADSLLVAARAVELIDGECQ